MQLQQQMTRLRQQRKQERSDLYKGMARHYRGLERQQDLENLLRQERQERKRSPSHDNGPTHEPEV